MSTNDNPTATDVATPGTNNDRRSVEERRQQLVDAALTVMAEQGLTKATTRAITEEAGLALGAFHYVFTSKDELLGAVIEQTVGKIDAVLERTLEAAEPKDTAGDQQALVAEALQRFVADLWEYFESTPQLHLAQYELTLHALRDPSLRHLGERQYDLYSATVARGLERLTGEVGSGPANELARYVVATVDGMLLQWLVEGDAEAARARLVRYQRTLPAIVAAHREPLD